MQMSVTRQLCDNNFELLQKWGNLSFDIHNDGTEPNFGHILQSKLEYSIVQKG